MMPVFDSRTQTSAAALLLVTAMIIHIAVIATPSLADMDVPAFFDNLNETIQDKQREGWSERKLNVLKKVQSAEEHIIAKGSVISYGMTKMCAEVTFLGSFTAETCVSWDSVMRRDRAVTLRSPEWLKGVSGCFITGMIFIAIAVIMSNTFVHTASKGDRGRILPWALCGSTLIAAVINIIGLIIVLAKYKTYSELNIITRHLPEDIFNAVTKAMSDETALSWGFPVDLLACACLTAASGLFYKVSRAVVIEPVIRHQQLRQDILNSGNMENGD